MEDSKYINKVIYLDNNDILPNRFQPRKYFDEEEIKLLVDNVLNSICTEQGNRNNDHNTDYFGQEINDCGTDSGQYGKV